MHPAPGSGGTQHHFQPRLLVLVLSAGMATLLTGCFSKLSNAFLERSSLQSANSLTSCNNDAAKAFFRDRVNPMLENKCASCHSGRTPVINRGTWTANYSQAKGKGGDLVLYATNQRPHAGGQILNEPEAAIISDWLNQESRALAACQTTTSGETSCTINSRSSNNSGPGVTTNLSRFSGSGAYARLVRLFPGQSIDPVAFDQYLASGLDRMVARPERFISATAQIGFQNRVEKYCEASARTPNATPGAIFAEHTVQGETQPTDAAHLAAANTVRNAWLAPFSKNDPLVTRMRDLYQAAYTNAVLPTNQGGGGMSTGDATIAARASLCLAALQAPQFWLGSDRPDDILRRISTELFRRPPTASDYQSFANASDKAAFIRGWMQNLQSGVDTQPAYLNQIDTLFRDKWGLRPLDQLDNPGGRAWDPRERSGTNNGPSLLAGTFSQYTRFPTLGSNWLDNQLELKLDVINTSSFYPFAESCSRDQGGEQTFDPRTTRLEFQVFNRVNGINRWETLAGWNRNGAGGYDEFQGAVTLSDSTQRAIRLQDITHLRLASGAYDNPNAQWTFQRGYNGTAQEDQIALIPEQSRLIGTPVERIRTGDFRIVRTSPSGIQNGYSSVRLPVTGERAYVCNSIMRFVASCFYRGWSPNRRPYGNLRSNNSNLIRYDANNQLVVPARDEERAWNAVGLGYVNADRTSLRREVHPIMNSTEGSILYTHAHPLILGDFRCGVPSPADAALAGLSNFAPDTAYPHGFNPADYTNPTAPSPDRLNPIAINAYYPRNSNAADAAETAAIRAIKSDLEKETTRLLQSVISGERDFREVLTATYTHGSDYYRYYRNTQAFILPFEIPGFSFNADPLAVRQFSASGFQPVNRRWLHHATANGPPNALPAVLSNYYNTFGGSTFIGSPQVGILTQYQFNDPVRSKLRTRAARVLIRVAGIPVNYYQPQGGALDLHLRYVTQATHLQSTCIDCHKNMDPLAAALDANFAADPTMNNGSVQKRAGETYAMTRGSGAIGIRGMPNQGQGALFGQAVTGISGVATTLSNSRYFARAVTAYVFFSVFGREAPSVPDCELSPTHADCVLIDQQADRFMTTYNYNFNRLYREVAASALSLRGN